MKKEIINSNTVEWIKSISIAVVIAIVIKTFVFNTALVVGESMSPTLHEKDRLIANKISPKITGYKRGDIVILDAPDVKNKSYIKRIIGMPGDKIEILDGHVLLNGERLEEDYTEEKYTDKHGNSSWIVKDNEVFVLGDNRKEYASKDSRIFGCVPINSLKGKINIRYYPFKKVKKFKK